MTVWLFDKFTRPVSPLQPTRVVPNVVSFAGDTKSLTLTTAAGVVETVTFKDYPYIWIDTREANNGWH